jgi:non-ribosomal peptide synthetase component F
LCLGSGRRVGHPSLLHPFQVLLLQVRHARNREIKFIGPASLDAANATYTSNSTDRPTMATVCRLRRCRHSRVEWCAERAGRAVVRRPQVPLVAQVNRVHQHLVRMVRVMLRHGGVVRLRPGRVLVWRIM